MCAGLVLHDRPNGWGMESTHFHRKNVVIYDIITGRIQTPLVGTSLLPLVIDCIPDLKKDLHHFQGLDPPKKYRDGGGARSSRLILHSGRHLETAGDHCRTSGMPPYLWALYQRRLGYGDNMDDYIVRSGCGTIIWGVDGYYVLI